MKIYLAILITVFLNSCASNPSVVQVGTNQYLSSVTSAAGAFSSASNMKVKAIQQANRFAEKHGGIAVETESKFNRPAVGFPTYDHYFEVVAP